MGQNLTPEMVKTDKKLFEMHETENTPFRIIEKYGEKTNEILVVIGNHIATSKYYETVEQAKEDIYKLNWELINSLVYHSINFNKQLQSIQDNTKKPGKKPGNKNPQTNHN